MANYLSVHDDSGRPLLTEVILADSHWLRLRGLMFQTSLRQDEGLLLTPCNAIHCWFMRMPIDVLFLSEDDVVVKIISHMKPWRLSPIVRKAKSVLECAAGTVERLGIREGQVLKLEQDAG